MDFVRSDGRNLQGVDVPYPFDGALTFTAQRAAGSGFTLVRVQAKEESPLQALTSNGAIAGHLDHRGNHVLRHGPGRTRRQRDRQISVNFADWGDPKNGG